RANPTAQACRSPPSMASAEECRQCMPRRVVALDPLVGPAPPDLSAQPQMHCQPFGQRRALGRQDKAALERGKSAPTSLRRTPHSAPQLQEVYGTTILPSGGQLLCEADLAVLLSPVLPTPEEKLPNP